MKAQKLLSLDVEIIEALKKEENGSKLVNDLLKDYFNTGGGFNKKEILNKIEIKKLEINKSNEEIFELKEKLEEIQEREKNSREKFKNIPVEIMDDFKFFPKMTLEVLESRFKEIYSKKYSILESEVIKAYEEYFNVEM